MSHSPNIRCQFFCEFSSGLSISWICMSLCCVSVAVEWLLKSYSVCLLTVFLICKISLLIQDPLGFHMNFSITMSIFVKMGFCLGMYWLYRSIWRKQSQNIKSSNHENDIVLHLFVLNLSQWYPTVFSEYNLCHFVKCISIYFMFDT